MTLTIECYLDELPEPYRSKALANMLPDAADLPVHSLTDALLDAFRFQDTPEGSEYWNMVLEEFDESILED